MPSRTRKSKRQQPRPANPPPTIAPAPITVEAWATALITALDGQVPAEDLAILRSQAEAVPAAGRRWHPSPRPSTSS